MKSSEQNLLRGLLTGSAVLALGVLVDDKPYVGQLPFALWPEHGSLLIHVSSLARHSRGLGDGEPFSALIGGATVAGQDPFQIPRVSLEGSIRRLDRTVGNYAEARGHYLVRLPSAEGHFQLGDFTLIELVPTKSRFVAGFARTYNLTPGAFVAATTS